MVETITRSSSISDICQRVLLQGLWPSDDIMDEVWFAPQARRRTLMASRFKVGSPRTFMAFVGFIIVFGNLVEIDKGSGRINRAIQLLWVAFVLISSAVIIIRMWRMRGSPDEFKKVAHGGLVGVLPPKWRRWILGEDDPEQASAPQRTKHCTGSDSIKP